MAFGLRKGDVFAGRYQVERLLAAGGMGAVYEVIHQGTQRRRALKVMLPHVLDNDEMRERFKREALVAAGVESEFIVDVFDAGVDEETSMPFLLMELLRGEDLGKRVKRSGRLDPAEAITYLHQTARALDKMHRASLVHRDLKPDNVFLAEREEGPPRVKLLDFGVAKVVAESAAGGTEMVGTPSYMAPEQFHAGLPVTPASDVYALGMMAYTLLVGVPYWADEGGSGNAFTVALRAVGGPSEPASVRAARRGTTLPPGFDAWFATITTLDPARRFASAGAAVRSLGDVLGVGLPLTATMEGMRVVDPLTAAPLSERAPLLTPTPTGLPSYSSTVRQLRSPWRPALVAAGLLALGGGLAAALWLVFAGPAPHPVAAASASASALPEPAPSAAASASAALDAGAPAPAASTTAPASAAPVTKPAAATPQKSTPRPHPTAVYSQE